MNTQKKSFKMPHLFWIMVFLLLFASALTYVVPAGKFAVDENGKIIGGQFSYLGSQNPINPWRMFMLVLQGLRESGSIIWVVLCSGAMTAVVMATGAIDEILNWAIYKLKDKNENILISTLFILMVYLGGFGGTDGLIAIVPIGVIFAKKLKLDPICAMGVSTYATLIGFGTGPAKQSVTQLMMGVRLYGAFGTMFISMNFFMLFGLYFLLRYKNKIRKDPTKSLMYSEGWNPENIHLSAEDEEAIAKGVKLKASTIIILIIFLVQYMIIVLYPFMGGESSKILDLMVALAIIVSVLSGIIGRFSFDKIGDEFAKGLATLAFVGFVIGLARVMSLVMDYGNIIHTIVYQITRPLLLLPKSVSSIGMTAVISVVNLFIPSGSAKAAILVPILKPVAEALNINKELAVQAFQYGDGFTNLVSPFLGWTVGSLIMANVPFSKWFRWVFPKVIIFILTSFVIIFMLTEIGWTAF